MANEVRLHASMKDDVSGPLTKIKDQFTHLSANKAGAALLEGVGVGAGISVYGALSTAISHVVDWVGQAGEAYAQDQVSVAQLTTSLKDNVAGWNGNTDAIEATIRARTRLGFSDDEQRAALASLIAITKDSNSALADEAIAMNLARLRGLDLATASEIIGKVAGGNTSILRRYGIEVTKGATATEALAEVQKLAAGQAEAYANTNAGKLAAAQDKVLEAQEKLGKIMSEAEAVILPALADAISTVVDRLTDFGNAIGSVAGPANDLLKTLTGSTDVLGDLGRGLDVLSYSMTHAGDVSGYLAQKQQEAAQASVAAWEDQQASVRSAAAAGLAELQKSRTAMGVNPTGELVHHTQIELANQGKIVAQYAAKIRNDMHAAAIKADQAFADGLTQQRSDIDNAMQAIVDGLKKPMTRSKEIAHDLGLLTSKALAEGLRSGDPAIVAASEAERQRILDRLDQLSSQAGPIGKEGMDALAKAMKSKDGVVSEAAQSIYASIARRLRQKIDGSAIGTAWITSLANAIHKGANVQLARALNNVKGQLAGKSPPPEGPLHTIDRDAEPVGHAWVGGLSRGITRSLGTLSGSLAGVQPALGVAGAMGSAGGGSGLTININGVSVLTPGAAEALGRQLGPHVTRWQQGRNILPRLGTGLTG